VSGTISGGWRLLRQELGERRRSLMAILAWSALQATPALCEGFFLARAIDRGFLAGAPEVGFGWLVAIGAVSIVALIAQRQVFPHLADVVEPLRDSLTRLVVFGTIRGAMNDDRPVDLAGAARITGQVEMTRNVVSALLRSVNQLGLSLIAATAGLATLAPAVIPVVVACLVVALAVFVLVVRALFTRRQALVLAEERLAATANHVFAGSRDIAAMQAHDKALGEVGRSIEEAARSARALTVTGLLNTLVTLIGAQLPIFVLLLAAPALIGEGQLAAGVVLGAVTYLRGPLMGGLGSVMSLVSGWGLQLGVTAQRISEVGGQAERIEGGEPSHPDGFQLHLKDVTFAYAPTAVPVLDGFDLTVEEGDHLAILGTSGIGKSTLAYLLCGLLRPQRGRVELGTVPLARIARDQLRSQVALIPQEAYVFDGTVRENLTYLCPDASAVLDADLDRSIDALHLWALIRRLGGYDARLNAGLSQGERQLIALARVHLSPASIVILDEVTCHLDPATEAQVERAFVERHGTLIVIAHRVSSALRAQRVVLFDGTKIMHGSHAHLLGTSSSYRDLVNRWNGEFTRPGMPPAFHTGAATGGPAERAWNRTGTTIKQAPPPARLLRSQPDGDRK
jgi:ABC-type multidrug transport system fused ATPase/permease subunit